MAYRYFVDSRGTHWRVWDVAPSPVDRRYHVRRIRMLKVHHSDRRRLPTRRIDMARSWLYFPPGEPGWLCFESATERLRLRPIPPGWLLEPDDGLERLAGQARECAGAGREPSG